MRYWNRFRCIPRDEGDAGGTPPTPQTPPAGNPATPTAAPDMGALADTLLKAIEGRTRRAESGVLKSMAEQYGMQESELTGILDKAKAEKAKQLPDAARQQIEAATQRANNRLIAAEVKLLGSQMGLLDADVAMRLPRQLLRSLPLPCSHRPASSAASAATSSAATALISPHRYRSCNICPALLPSYLEESPQMRYTVSSSHRAVGRAAFRARADAGKGRPWIESFPLPRSACATRGRTAAGPSCCWWCYRWPDGICFIR